MKDIPVRKINSSPKELNFPESFSMRDVRDLLDGNELVHELHRHDFFFILALQRGRGTHEIDFTDYKVCDHTVFILRPGQVHKLNLKSDCTGFLMEFSPGFYQPNDILLNQRLGRASGKNLCELGEVRFEKLLSVMTNILNEFISKQEGYWDVIKSSLNIFFIELIRQSQNSRDNLRRDHSYTQDRFGDFLDLLAENITKRRQVSQYADLMNISTYQLNAITKATVGKTASEIVNEQIILEAKRYLLATHNQVKDIADHLGYEDISYFIRFFKKHTAYSPDAFRKKFQ